jgi:hypothetical protein
LLGPDSGNRRDRTAEYVVSALELLGPLENRYVLCAFNYAHHRWITTRVEANGAFDLSGNVEAAAAQAHLLTHIDDGVRKAIGISFLDIQQMENKALRAFPADAGKTRKLID